MAAYTHFFNNVLHYSLSQLTSQHGVYIQIWYQAILLEWLRESASPASVQPRQNCVHENSIYIQKKSVILSCVHEGSCCTLNQATQKVVFMCCSVSNISIVRQINGNVIVLEEMVIVRGPWQIDTLTQMLSFATGKQGKSHEKLSIRKKNNWLPFITHKFSDDPTLLISLFPFTLYHKPLHQSTAYLMKGLKSGCK